MARAVWPVTALEAFAACFVASDTGRVDEACVAATDESLARLAFAVPAVVAPPVAAEAAVVVWALGLVDWSTVPSVRLPDAAVDQRETRPVAAVTTVEPSAVAAEARVDWRTLTSAPAVVAADVRLVAPDAARLAADVAAAVRSVTRELASAVGWVDS